MTDSPKRIRRLRNGDLDVDGQIMVGGGGKDWFYRPPAPEPHYVYPDEVKRIEARYRSRMTAADMPMTDASRDAFRSAVDQARERLAQEPDRGSIHVSTTTYPDGTIGEAAMIVSRNQARKNSEQS